MKSHGKEFIGSLIVKSAGSVPSSGAEGELFYNTGDSSLYVANGSTFSAVGGAASSLIKSFDPFGDDVLHALGNGVYVGIQTHGGTPKARVSAYDVLSSVHGGVGTLYYSVSTDNVTYTTPNTDPKEAYIEYTCTDVGMLGYIYVKITDSDTPAQETMVALFVMVQDNAGLCGA